MSDDRAVLDQYGALEHLRGFVASRGLDPRIDLVEVVMETFRAVHGRVGWVGDRVSAAALEQAAAIAWSHLSDVRSAVPCPSWCSLEVGHPYQDEDRAGNLTRFHDRRFGDSAGASVQISQLETALGPEGPISLEPPEAFLAIGDKGTDGGLSSATCVELGHALIDAGEALARIANFHSV